MLGSHRGAPVAVSDLDRGADRAGVRGGAGRTGPKKLVDSHRGWTGTLSSRATQVALLQAAWTLSMSWVVGWAYAITHRISWVMRSSPQT
jgi:hypothetical protein